MLAQQAEGVVFEADVVFRGAARTQRAEAGQAGAHGRRVGQMKFNLGFDREHGG